MEVVVVKPLKPFLTYFGGKWRAVPIYPEPQYNTIIEPFAGAAGYSLHYWDRQIILNELNPDIASMWRWLISADPLEILNLPTKIWSIDEAPDLIPEAKLLIGYWFNKGVGGLGPRYFRTKWSITGSASSFWSDAVKLRIASQLKYIRHWKIINGTYADLENQEATWFIDPPYQQQGIHYQYNSIDFNHLTQWCQSRYGQVMVCENLGADWLPFEYLGSIQARPKGGKISHEVLYTQHSKAPSVVSIE